jgi:transketolase
MFRPAEAHGSLAGRSLATLAPEVFPAMTATTRPSAAAPAATHDDMANAIRALAMDAVEQAKSGHPGMPMGMADAATVLFTRFLKFDPAKPDWPDRDRFVLSAGHGSMLLYALLHLTGYTHPTMDELRRFRQLGSPTAGHPERWHPPGVETTTGPLGQGLANAVGMAIAERHLAAAFGPALVDHRTYVVAGDGCLMEGISHEAISLAGHLKLGRLIVLWDDNRISIDGPTDLAVSDDQIARFRAAGWATLAVDGHAPDAIADALAKAQASDRPVLIACRTTIAKGAPTKAGTAGAHGAPLGEAEIRGAREKLGWPHPPFAVPESVLAAWRAAGARGAAARKAWEARLAAHPQRAAFAARVAGDLPADWRGKLRAHVDALVAKPVKTATRQASGMALDVLAPAIPAIVGGSADLTGSNNTRAKSQTLLTARDYGGTYIHYGVREHAMAAAMNGMALHGGIVPYGGTFLVFADYCRPAIRLAAIMGLRVVFVMTHDSIGLGEDGPTHQPVEHLASLRAIPGLNVFRPADAVETAECWELALLEAARPSVLALTRQSVPQLRTEAAAENRCARGGYVLAEAAGDRRATILASGSEVQIALAARALLQKEGVPTAVVSMPSFELFDRQDAGYRAAVLGPAGARVAVEAAVRQGWDKYIGAEGGFVGMAGFGAAAPFEQLYAHFGITAEAVAAAVRQRL